MGNTRKFLFILILFLMILNACAPKTSPSSPAPQQPSVGMVAKAQAPFVQAAKAALSQKLSVQEWQVSFVSVDPVEWPDSCLGLAGPGEFCLLAITPGYKVILSVDGKQYEVHTDETGSAVRIKD